MNIGIQRGYILKTDVYEHPLFKPNRTPLSAVAPLWCGKVMHSNTSCFHGNLSSHNPHCTLAWTMLSMSCVGIIKVRINRKLTLDKKKKKTVAIKKLNSD